MTFGLREEDWQTLVEVALSPLKSVAGIRLWVFGSRARGDHKPFSDLDILIDGPSLPPGLLALVRERLEESSLPINVDLVLESELASSYRDGVLRDRKEI